MYRLVSVILCCATLQGAHAQGYPTRDLRLIIASAPGGNIDLAARRIADGLVRRFGVRILFDYRPGASGAIANDALIRAVPDGYTLLMTAGSYLTTAPHARSGPDPLTLVTPVSIIATYPFMLAVHSGSPVDSLGGLVTLAKKRPGELTYGSSGAWSGQHLAGALLEKMAGVRMVHVPYRGTPAGVLDLLGGRLDALYLSPAVGKPYVDEGTMRPLITTGMLRSPLLPDTPTVAELGYPGYAVSGWVGLFVPVGVSPEIVRLLNSTVGDILLDPQVQEAMRSQSEVFEQHSPAEALDRARTEQQYYGALMRELGVVPQ
ncbi:tripartite tricarboxylate transporter substrate binding protein [Candidatus Kaiserbacteria bacterium]|nr:tripartite tricarboxylate transporter substrate binding protein [Candidatus Kaiserbacteria bacterium]